MNAETERTPEAEATGAQEKQPAEIVTPDGEPVKECQPTMSREEAAQEVRELLDVAQIILINCRKPMEDFYRGHPAATIELDSIISDAELLAKKVKAIAEEGLEWE